MSLGKIIPVIFLFLIAGQSHSQVITRRLNNYVLVGMDESSGYRVGDPLRVCRKSGNSEREIGRIVIVRFKDSQCAGKIDFERSGERIKVGDFVRQSRLPGNGVYSGSQGNQHTVTYLSIGAGVVGLGLGYYFYDKANSTFEKYKTANTRADADKLYNQTVSYDKKTQLSLGIGAGLTALGLVYEIFHKSPDSRSNRFNINVKSGMLNVTCNF